MVQRKLKGENIKRGKKKKDKSGECEAAKNETCQEWNEIKENTERQVTCHLKYSVSPVIQCLRD